ncbi:MAG: hypothetical protein AB7O52_02625 [Planctomycetota bacterium]
MHEVGRAQGAVNGSSGFQFVADLNEELTFFGAIRPGPAAVARYLSARAPRVAWVIHPLGFVLARGDRRDEEVARQALCDLVSFWDMSSLNSVLLARVRERDTLDEFLVVGSPYTVAAACGLDWDTQQEEFLEIFGHERIPTVTLPADEYTALRSKHTLKTLRVLPKLPRGQELLGAMPESNDGMRSVGVGPFDTLIEGTPCTANEFMALLIAFGYPTYQTYGISIWKPNYVEYSSFEEIADWEDRFADAEGRLAAERPSTESVLVSARKPDRVPAQWSTKVLEDPFRMIGK